MRLTVIPCKRRRCRIAAALSSCRVVHNCRYTAVGDLPSRSQARGKGLPGYANTLARAACACLAKRTGCERASLFVRTGIQVRGWAGGQRARLDAQGCGAKRAAGGKCAYPRIACATASCLYPPPAVVTRTVYRLCPDIRCPE